MTKAAKITAEPDRRQTSIVLAPGLAERHYYADLWKYRDLFAILAWRDVAVQYKQTVIGIAWAVVRPLLTMIIFTVIFGRLAKLPSESEAPYAVMVMAGMLPWFLFSTTMSQAANSLVTNGNLISKVYFPRLIIPVASSMVALVDFAITLVLLLVLLVVYGVMPGWQIVFLPVFTVLALIAALGPSLLLAALNVKYRDFRFVLPFIIQFGLYVSPVGFSSGVVPEQWRLFYAMNPVVGIIDGFRWCLLGGTTPLYLPGLLLSLSISTLFLWIGIRTFRKTEKTFADLV